MKRKRTMFGIIMYGFYICCGAEVIIVHAKLQGSKKLRSSHEEDLYSYYCHSDTGTSKTNYRHLLLVNSSSENFEKCCCTYRLIWDQVHLL